MAQILKLIPRHHFPRLEEHGTGQAGRSCRRGDQFEHLLFTQLISPVRRASGTASPASRPGFEASIIWELLPWPAPPSRTPKSCG
ncbi:MAG: DUF4372 domain-containing protein [Desulfobaccales bacterium]